MKRITRITATALSILMLTQSLAGCSAKKSPESRFESIETTSIESAVAGASLSSETKSIVTLKNHMTDQERAKVTEGPLQVLDEPWKQSGEDASDPYKEGYSSDVPGCDRENISEASAGNNGTEI